MALTRVSPHLTIQRTDRRHFNSDDSRIYPADDHQSLYDTAVAEGLGRLATIQFIGQGGQGGNANEEEDEADGHGDEVGEDAEKDVPTEKVEADAEDD